MKDTITEKKDQFLKQRTALNYEIYQQEQRLASLKADLHAVTGAIQTCDILLKEEAEATPCAKSS